MLRSCILVSRACIPGVAGEMHTIRRALRRIARSLNPCDDISFTKRGALGYDPRSSTPNERDALPSCNIAGQDLVRNSALSRTFARNFGTSARKEPPRPRGGFLGELLCLRKAGGAYKLHEYVDGLHRKLGPVFKARLGPLQAVFVNSPDEYRRIFLQLEGRTPQNFLPEVWRLYNEIWAQRRGLLFMSGDEWLHYRKILNKTVLMPKTKKFMRTPCQEAAENLVRKWKTYSRAGCEVPDLQSQLYQWSIEVMLATLIGSRWQDYEQQMRPEIEDIALTVHQIFILSAKLSLMPAKWAMRFRLPLWTEFVKTADTILDKVRNLVPEMIRPDNDGLLQAIMNDGIRGDYVVRIIVDFILAAGDTTANTMQWTLLLLAGRPELQDQLFNDIKDLSQEKILQHRLLRNTWKESMRLYPVPPFLSRYLPVDATIGGYSVSKGELVLMSLYSSSRDENNFPKPNEFWPERWIKTEEGHYQGVKKSYATIPFAIGARSCIGRRLAETQLSLTLAQLIKNYKIECENRDSIKMVLHLISVPSMPIKLKLKDREI